VDVEYPDPQAHRYYQSTFDSLLMINSNRGHCLPFARQCIFAYRGWKSPNVFWLTILHIMMSSDINVIYTLLKSTF